jgi:hypothetical protein
MSIWHRDGRRHRTMPTKEIVSPVPVLNPWTFSAANLANEFMAVPGPADDLLERHPVPDERHDLGIDILAPQIASILPPFRSEHGIEPHVTVFDKTWSSGLSASMRICSRRQRMCSSSGMSSLRLRDGSASKSRLRGHFDKAFIPLSRDGYRRQISRKR